MVIIAVLVSLRKVDNWWWLVAAGMVLGGGVGNLIDRLTRPPGFGIGRVVDFIAYWDWFIGNIADIAIVAAVVLVMGLTLLGVPWKKPVGESKE
jgi:signal peptidase II